MSTETYMANLLGAFATTVATSIDQQVAELGLRSANAATALVTIRNHPDDSIDILRRTLSLTHSGAVRLIDGLEAEDLVERHRSGDDGRSVVIRLTDEGQKRANKVLKARARVTNAVLDSLSAEQRASIAPMLEAALKALTHGEDSARRNCRLCDERVCRPRGCPVETAGFAAT